MRHVVLCISPPPPLQGLPERSTLYPGVKEDEVEIPCYAETGNSGWCGTCLNAAKVTTSAAAITVVFNLAEARGARLLQAREAGGRTQGGREGGGGGGGRL